MTYHYYASSQVQWQTDTDLADLIKYMESDKMGKGKEPYPYAVWLVPVDQKDHYVIRRYAPVVAGATLIYVSEPDFFFGNKPAPGDALTDEIVEELLCNHMG